jgi:arsenite-transporting ATPase
MRPGAAVADGLADHTTRLLMFGGKGGVGKTTCAAAAALVLSARRPGSRTLLLSTDPAHSLEDALGIRIGDEPVRLPRSRLVVRELDARARFETLRERYARAVEEVFDRIVRGSAVDATLDRRVMANLIDLAPPGVDELVGIAEIADLLDDGHGGRLYDLVVVDMAPSGHALRLLTSPALVQEWARTIMAILLKYQAVVSVGELGSMLLELSRSLGRFNVLLHDATRTRVVAVTRAAALPLAETRRFVAHLKSLKVPVSHVLVNAVGRGTCPRCRRVAAAERRELAATRSALRGQELILTPAELPPPCAAAGLRRWANTWRG